MKIFNNCLLIIFLSCCPFLVYGAPTVNKINPQNSASLPKVISKKKLKKDKPKKVGFGAKLKMRLLTKIVEKKLKKVIQKGVKHNEKRSHNSYAAPQVDSFTYAQFIAVKTRDLIKVFGLKQGVKTRAFLNRTKYEFKQNLKANPALANEKIAKADLIMWLQNSELSAAEIAQYSGIGSAFSILGFFLFFSEGLLLAGLILGIVSLIAYVTALFWHENAGCLGALLSLIAVGGTIIVILIAIGNSQ